MNKDHLFKGSDGQSFTLENMDRYLNPTIGFQLIHVDTGRIAPFCHRKEIYTDRAIKYILKNIVKANISPADYCVAEYRELSFENDAVKFLVDIDDLGNKIIKELNCDKI